jgi:hypothetical protein
MLTREQIASEEHQSELVTKPFLRVIAAKIVSAG